MKCYEILNENVLVSKKKKVILHYVILDFIRGIELDYRIKTFIEKQVFIK